MVSAFAVYSGVLLATYLCADVFYSSIEFSPGTITYKKLRKTQTMPLQNILGRREVINTSNEGSTKYYFLVSSDANYNDIKFEMNFNFDEEFKAWFYALPFLDKK